MSLPDVVSPEEWRQARVALLEKEKAAVRARDELNAERRRLPMTPVDTEYVFDTPAGRRSLLELFEGRRQLIVYHFMFQPEWDAGCPSCSFQMDNLMHLSHLHARDTTFTAVSRAPLSKIEAYRTRMGWTFPWASSEGTTFNRDFHVTLGGDDGSDEYNYRPRDPEWTGDAPGLSAFLRDGETVFHTYSTYQRGLDILLTTYNFLDLTALGRQETFEEPKGRVGHPDDDWTRRHDEYAGQQG